MRKSEREVTEPREKFAALLKCGYITIAVNGESGAPYALPLNFGAELKGDRLFIYFHCALEGKKSELMRKDPHIGFSAANMIRVFNKRAAPCGYTADYESVCGTGRVRFLTDSAERIHALQKLTEHYAGKEFPPESFDEKALSLTCVGEIEAEEWHLKRLIRPAT